MIKERTQHMKVTEVKEKIHRAAIRKRLKNRRLFLILGIMIGLGALLLGVIDTFMRAYLTIATMLLQ